MTEVERLRAVLEPIADRLDAALDEAREELEKAA
jgi:hypothetical protein